jgi:DNA (cytosine-5)-methyltransferase 1
MGHAYAMRPMTDSSASPTAIDLFCGCGGISAGLRDAGFRILCGADMEPNYVRTFRHNFPEATVVTEDLSRLAPLELIGRLGIAPGELDLLAGGPPCQGFSKNVPRRQRVPDSSNNRLIRTFLDHAVAIRPRMVLMENVAEMRNGFDGAYSDGIVSCLEDAGYRVSHGVLNAADHGVPQRRRRAFFIAWRGERPLAFPTASHLKPAESDGVETPRSPGGDARKGHVTVWEAIGDLPSVPHDESRASFAYRCAPFSDYQRIVRRGRDVVANHAPRKLASTQHERLASLKPGQGLKELPLHLRPRSGYSGAYGRLTRDMVAPTITRWVFHPGSGRFGHPDDIRMITIREAARLQGFADDFEFTGTYTQQAGQVGNAVPPLLIESIARSMLAQARLGESGLRQSARDAAESLSGKDGSDVGQGKDGSDKAERSANGG